LGKKETATAERRRIGAKRSSSGSNGIREKYLPLRKKEATFFGKEKILRRGRKAPQSTGLSRYGP